MVYNMLVFLYLNNFAESLMIMKIKSTSIIVLVLACTLSLLAEEAWEQRRDELELKIDQETRAQVESQITRDLVILDLKLTPPFVPTRSVEDIMKEGEEKITAELKRLIEISTEDIYRKAEDYFPFYKVGDKITVPALRPDEPDITGILIRFDKNFLMIGRTRVARADLSERYRNCVDEEWVREERDKYVQIRLTGLQQKREIMSENLRRKYIDEVILAAGYLPSTAISADEEEIEEENPRGETIVHWTTAENVIQQTLAARREAAFNRLRPEMAKKIFTENGFRFYKTENQWLPVKGEGSPSLWTKFRNRND